MSHLPPQNPHDYPRIEGAGYLRNTPMPVPYGRYASSMGNPPMGQNAPVAGFGSNDPVLMEVQRKRSVTRKVSVSSCTIGLITMLIQVFITTFLFAANILPFLGFALLAVLIMIAGPFVVGLVWVATLIVALIACIRAHSRTPRVQPDGWVEAKMPTSALLAASVVAGLPIFIICVVWPLTALSGSTLEPLLEPLLVVCDLVEVLIAVGLVFLLRLNKALDPAVRASQAPGTQPA